MTERWRLLDTGPRPAAENMPPDEAILDARSRNLITNTLRFLQFWPRCTLVGYHQAVEQEVRLGFCRAHGIEVNRRITGGGALFWDESQLGWEVYAPMDHPRLPRCWRIFILAWARVRCGPWNGWASVLPSAPRTTSR